MRCKGMEASEKRDVRQGHSTKSKTSVGENRLKGSRAKELIYYYGLALKIFIPRLPGGPMCRQLG